MRLSVHRLMAGELPIFNLASNEHRWWCLDEFGSWQSRMPFGPRAVLPTGVNTILSELPNRLRQWLEGAPVAEDGTLLFALQGCFQGYTRMVVPAPGVTSLTVTNDQEDSSVWGALGILPGFFGEFVKDIDEACEAIVELCQVEYLEPVSEQQHPAVQTAQGQYHLKHEAARLRMVKARKLLCRWLSPEQLAEFETKHRFHVRGADGHLYVIYDGYGHNVFRIEDGRKTMCFCLVTDKVWVPSFDLMLAQKVLLESDVGTFLDTANQREVKPQDYPVVDMVWEEAEQLPTPST